MEKDITGFLLINKPAGWTSFDVVAHIRKMTGIKKVGHTGTLDPAGEGLLIVCIGKGTKYIKYITDYDKTYLCKGFLGEKRDTDDKDGKVVFRGNIDNITEEKFKEVFFKYRGKFIQKVPLFSAVKKNGKRLYEIAREGKEVELPEKEVEVKESQLLSVEFPFFTFRMKVSTGTYLRSIVRDIGDELGCGAYLYSLTRESIGPFHIDKSVKLSDLSRHNIKDYIRPINELFIGLPYIEVGDRIIKRGTIIPNTKKDGVYVVMQNGIREGIGVNKNGFLRVERLFE